MSSKKIDVLMVGTGEYTTGYVGGTAADSDKGAGVVALTMFDMRRRGKVDRVAMCGVNVSFMKRIIEYIILGFNLIFYASTTFMLIGEKIPWNS